eukprot:767885-Hanusia_phi.AAC.8
MSFPLTSKLPLSTTQPFDYPTPSTAAFQLRIIPTLRHPAVPTIDWETPPHPLSPHLRTTRQDPQRHALKCSLGRGLTHERSRLMHTSTLRNLPRSPFPIMVHLFCPVCLLCHDKTCFPDLPLDRPALMCEVYRQHGSALSPVAFVDENLSEDYYELQTAAIVLSHSKQFSNKEGLKMDIQSVKNPGEVSLDTDDLIKKFDAAIAETLADLDTSYDKSATSRAVTFQNTIPVLGNSDSPFNASQGNSGSAISSESRTPGTNMNVPNSRTAPDVSDAEIRNMSEAFSDVEINIAKASPSLQEAAQIDMDQVTLVENVNRNSVNSQTMKTSSLASMAPIQEGEVVDDNMETVSPFETQKLSGIRTEFSGSTPLKRVGTWIEKHKSGKKGRSTMGNVVTKESQSWNFVSALTSGIQSTIHRETMDGHQCGSDLDPMDFHECFKSSTVTPEKGLYKFKDYAPKVFRNLRFFFGVDDKAYLQSIQQDGLHEISTAETGSKSGQKFLISADGRYFMKTITKSECKFFRKVIAKVWYEFLKIYVNLNRFYLNTTHT